MFFGRCRSRQWRPFTDFYGICFNNKLERYDGTLCRGPDRHSTNCLCCYMKAAQDLPSRSLLSYLPKGNRSRRLIAAFLRHLIRLPGLRRGTLAGRILDVTERNKTLKHLYGIYEHIVAPSDFLHEAHVANDLYPTRIHKINFGISLDLVKGYQTPRRKIDRRTQIRLHWSNRRPQGSGYPHRRLSPGQRCRSIARHIRAGRSGQGLHGSIAETGWGEARY